jgi:hypothetical protein
VYWNIAFKGVIGHFKIESLYQWKNERMNKGPAIKNAFSLYHEDIDLPISDAMQR